MLVLLIYIGFKLVGQSDYTSNLEVPLGGDLEAPELQIVINNPESI